MSHPRGSIMITKEREMLDKVVKWYQYPDGWWAGYDKDGAYVVSLSPDEGIDLGVR